MPASSTPRAPRTAKRVGQSPRSVRQNPSGSGCPRCLALAPGTWSRSSIRLQRPTPMLVRPLPTGTLPVRLRSRGARRCQRGCLRSCRSLRATASTARRPVQAGTRPTGESPGGELPRCRGPSRLADRARACAWRRRGCARSARCAGSFGRRRRAFCHGFQRRPERGRRATLRPGANGWRRNSAIGRSRRSPSARRRAMPLPFSVAGRPRDAAVYADPGHGLPRSAPSDQDRRGEERPRVLLYSSIVRRAAHCGSTTKLARPHAARLRRSGT